MWDNVFGSYIQNLSKYSPLPNCRGRVDYKNAIFNTRCRLLWPSHFTIFCPKFPIFFIFLYKLPEKPPFALYHDPSILKKIQKFPTSRLLNRRPAPPTIKHRRVWRILWPSSGAGKSTLLNMLSGRNKGMTLERGEIIINKKPATKLLRRQIGYVMQEDIFLSHLTVQQSLQVRVHCFSMNRQIYRKKKCWSGNWVPFLINKWLKHVRIDWVAVIVR